MTVKRIVPGLRINNRKNNLVFYEEVLGLKVLLEESAYAEIAGQEQKELRLLLTESPGNRSRAVNGLKKLARLVLKVANPEEITALLARGTQVDTLYRGERGYGFEICSPEGDAFLVHAEDEVSSLKEVGEGDFSGAEAFTGLSQIEVAEVVVHTPDSQASKDFYQGLFGGALGLSFEEAQGEDLLAAPEMTWDLDSLHFMLEKETELAEFEASLTGDYFKDKKGRFLQTADPSQIDVWLEK